jgi:lysophospholipase L1-like esterase
MQRPRHGRRLATVVAAATVLATAAMVTAGRADAATGCSVVYTVSNQWSDGFGASVEVVNLGDPLPAWSLVFQFPAGQTVGQLWNGTGTQTGSTVTVTGTAWNSSLAAGGTASFGFTGSWMGSNPAPTAFTLNGATCTGAAPTTAPAPTGPATSAPPAGPTSAPATTGPATSAPPTGATSAPAMPPATRPAGAPVRIMALGDSITGSPGCWRALLWQKLPATRVDFVGTLPGQGCGFPYDGENEGHGGFLATTVANQDQLVGWLAATKPDVVMMHFGTNDVWSNIAPDTILAAFTRMVGQMRTSNPDMKILVAKIIPMNPGTCPECGQRVVTFNNAIPAWAAGLTRPASPITVVDQWTGFDTATDTYDGVHPNDNGNAKIADKWYPALSAAIS